MAGESTTLYVSKIQLPNGTTVNIKDAEVPLVTKTYTGVLRNNKTYTSPYTNSYLYFGQIQITDLTKPASIRYHILAYTPSSVNYLLDSDIQWFFSTNGIYKAYCIFNNLNSTSYYPFAYHSLFSSLTKAISQSDGSYIGAYFGTSNSYGQNASTVARTIEVEILETVNCTCSLLNAPVWFHDTANMPANLVQPDTTVAYNTTNFTAVNVSTASGLQETGDANTNYYDRITWPTVEMTAGAASGRYSIGFLGTDGKFYGIARTSSTGTTKVLNSDIEFDPANVLYQLSNTYAANATVAAGACYSVYPRMDLRYSHNQGSFLTANRPVYMKLKQQDSGYFKIEPPTIFTQTLPSTNDGYFYKFVGMATDTYRMIFEPRETLLYHDGTKICRFGGGSSAIETVEVNGAALTVTDKTVDIPVPTSNSSSTTGISIADHSTTTITGVSGSTSVTGVQSTTTTASKVTLGTAISVPNVTNVGSASNWVFENITVPIKDSSSKTIPNVTATGSGSFTQGSFSGGSFTQGTDSFTTNVPTRIDTSKFNSGSFTKGAFSGGSGTFTTTVNNHVLEFSHTHTAATHANDSFTAPSLGTGFYTAGTAASFTQGEDEFTPATHGADSHTHVAPTLGTAFTITGVQSTTTTASHVKSGGNGTAPTLGTAISIPNVTAATDVTVPIKNTSATTVPTAAATATTVVTSKTHSITDNGHTHTLVVPE